jgi:hypothetical protein
MPQEERNQRLWRLDLHVEKNMRLHANVLEMPSFELYLDRMPVSVALDLLRVSPLAVHGRSAQTHPIDARHNYFSPASPSLAEASPPFVIC